jgi:thiamine biosynthesis lipoprotein
MFDREFDRRWFLKACGLLGVGVVAGSTVKALYDAVSFGNSLYKVTRTQPAMGTFVTMTAVDPSKLRAEEAIALAFEEMDRLIGLLNRYDSTSAVAILNEEGRLTGPPPEMLDLMDAANYFAGLTDCAFDVTVQPLVDLFASTRGSGPTEADVADALALVDFTRLRVSRNVISFEATGMGITLDGLAKGYIVDRASDVLAATGVTRHLINAGGDIRTRGSKETGEPWVIAIEDPDKKGHHPDVLHVTDAAIATSGSYEVFFDRERVFHHIVDPQRGASPQHNHSVTVRASSVMSADALSTAMFVLPAHDSRCLVEIMGRVESLSVRKNGTLERSQGWDTQAS